MLKAVYDIDDNGVIDAAESVPWEGITDVPVSFPPDAHDHDSDYSAIGHDHDSDYSAVGHAHDHGELGGLSDDDHTQYLLADGSRALSGATATRLLATDADKKPVSVGNLASWIAGTSNQVTVTDDTDGTITLSLPQDLHTSAVPTFGGVVAAYVAPASDATTAFQVRKADKSTAVLTVDTTNSRVGINATPDAGLEIKVPTSGTIGRIFFKAGSSDETAYFSVFDSAGTGVLPTFEFLSTGINGIGGAFTVRIPTANDSLSTSLAAMLIDARSGATGGDALSNANLFMVRNGSTPVFVIGASGNLGLSTTPDTRLDIDAGAIEFAEMTAPSGGAANTARLFARDNGSGKTQLCVIFNSGAVQVLATEP
jgi:hypothetical protein